MIRSILDVTRLCKTYYSITGDVHALRHVSFRLREGMTLGVLGESGSGKSTLGRCILRLIEPTEGQIRFDGEDITYLPISEMRRYRRRMQMIFQNPFSTLDPRMSVLESLVEPQALWLATSFADQSRMALHWLDRVGLDLDIASRFPNQLSGGQLQRVLIARAMIMEPKLVVLDEAVSSLDVSVQAQILDLLLDLQDELNLSYVFISHDLSVVEAMSDEVLVLHQGKVIEFSSSDEVFRFPKETYTQKLVGSLLRIPDKDQVRARVQRFYPN